MCHCSHILGQNWVAKNHFLMTFDSTSTSTRSVHASKHLINASTSRNSTAEDLERTRKYLHLVLRYSATEVHRRSVIGTYNENGSGCFGGKHPKHLPTPPGHFPTTLEQFGKNL